MNRDLKNYRAARSPWPVIAGSAIAVSFAFVVGPMDYAAAVETEARVKWARAATSHGQRVERVLLENSSRPADFDECQRTHKGRPRTLQVVSFQNGSATPWHHRTCYYDAQKGINIPDRSPR